jgi:ABC-type cobalamin/Fe3+-siderophores transport system ATPase subunit
MEFYLKVKNLGKIDYALIDVKPFTLIVGKNAEGKSFVTKSLYCILNTLNKNPIVLRIQILSRNIKDGFSVFYEMNVSKKKYDLENIRFLNEEFIPFLKEIIEEIKDKNIFQIKNILQKKSEYFSYFYEKLNKYVNRKKKLKQISFFEKTFLKELEKILEELKMIFFETNLMLIKLIEDNISDNFRKNFQQKNIGSLIKNNEEELNIDLEDIGSIKINNKGKIGFKFSNQGIEKVSNLKNIVYIDSPVYLKLKKGLERINPTLGFKKETLKGYPLYIDEFFSFLSLDVLEENEEKFKEISNYIQHLTNGKFQKNEIGDFEFVENDKYNIPLSLLAMGTSNLAIIEYLIRNNIISKNSFLIIDEPESHLHPSWQVELVEVLYKLAKNGVNVVITTHSIDIIKAIEVKLKEDKKAKNLIAVNKLPYKKEFKNKNIFEKIEECLKDIIEPYSNLVWGSL